MFRIRVEYLLKKNIEAVFDAISDHANYKQFAGIDNSILLHEGTHEPNGTGAHRIIKAGILELHESIIDYERPVKMHYRIRKARPVAMRHDKGEISLAPDGDSTRVIWVSEGHMKVPIVGNWVLDKLIEKNISKAFLAILKDIERR